MSSPLSHDSSYIDVQMDSCVEYSTPERPPPTLCSVCAFPSPTPLFFQSDSEWLSA